MLVFKKTPVEMRRLDGTLEEPTKMYVRWEDEQNLVVVYEPISFGAAKELAPGAFKVLMAQLEYERCNVER